jgi:hypothetical protein
LDLEAAKCDDRVEVGRDIWGEMELFAETIENLRDEVNDSTEMIKHYDDHISRKRLTRETTGYGKKTDQDGIYRLQDSRVSWTPLL